MESGKIEVREAVIRTIAMPSDTNPAGDIFGGG
jgi:acyl-CoA thioesterase YciA